MQKIISINIKTFAKAPILQVKVWINFSSPFNDLTNLKTLVTLKTLKTLIIWNDFKNAASIPSIFAITISAIEATTTKKSNTKTTGKSYGYYPTYHKPQPCLDPDLFKKEPAINTNNIKTVYAKTEKELQDML